MRLSSKQLPNLLMGIFSQLMAVSFLFLRFSFTIHVSLTNISITVGDRRCTVDSRLLLGSSQAGCRHQKCLEVVRVEALARAKWVQTLEGQNRVLQIEVAGTKAMVVELEG